MWIWARVRFRCTGHTRGAPARTHAHRTHVAVATHYIIVIYNIAARLVRRMFVYAIHITLYIYLTGARAPQKGMVL